MYVTEEVFVLGSKDPYLGAEGYYDGSDLSILLGSRKKLFLSEKRELELVYGDIFGPEPRQSDSFEPTRKLLRQIGTTV